MKPPPALTRNQSLVLEALADAASPLSAYGILDRVRPNGLRAPPQVYRALDKLLERGLVHRLESLNAFVACRRNHVRARGLVAFGICEDCGRVWEFEDETISGRLALWAAGQQFTAKATTIEIRGLCRGCESGIAGPEAGPR